MFLALSGEGDCLFLGVVVFDVPCDGCLSWDEFDDTDIIFFLACCADEVYVNPFGYKNVFCCFRVQSFCVDEVAEDDDSSFVIGNGFSREEDCFADA